MVTKETLSRLRWHAGLEDRVIGDVPSIASCSWPGSRSAGDFELAFGDYLDVLQVLNHELNGETPSHVESAHAAVLPRDLVYAISEVIRFLNERHEATERAGRTPDRASWRAEVAWAAVLAGDIDNIREHLLEEETAHFE